MTNLLVRIQSMNVRVLFAHPFMFPNLSLFVSSFHCSKPKKKHKYTHKTQVLTSLINSILFIFFSTLLLSPLYNVSRRPLTPQQYIEMFFIPFYDCTYPIIMVWIYHRLFNQSIISGHTDCFLFCYYKYSHRHYISAVGCASSGHFTRIILFNFYSNLVRRGCDLPFADKETKV